MGRRRGDERATLEGHQGGVDCVAFSPDRQTLVSGSKDGTIRVWDLKTGEETRNWPTIKARSIP